ncbi:MAG TPA: ribosomal protein S18-alanine N-acetyltransferase [Nevskiaceae bacterium]|nr:ribosomal protein S18-alanine N-acetyltransferase [Nevskiaceae bacterium]
MSVRAELCVADWRLRPMDVTQIHSIAAIDARAYRFPWTEGIFHDCLRAGYSAWVLWTREDDIAGYGLLSMGAGEAHVLNVCVAPEHQRRGYGRVLLMHLIDVARAANVETVLLEVRRSNAAAIALYRTAGFVAIGIRRGYYPDLAGREDALVYSLCLH